MNLGTIDLLTQVILAQGEGAGDGAGGGGLTSGPFGPMTMLILMVLFLYLMVMRPQQKRDKQRRIMLSSLSKGDHVVTTGGIKGTVVGLTEANVVLRVDDNTKIEFVRQAVAHIVPKDGDGDKAE